jgi:hypothetical protein
MERYEILSRASTFPVRVRRQHACENSLHFVTSAHVVAPWRYRKYYPDEWLDFVDERSTAYTLHLRDGDGNTLPSCEHAFKRRVFLHPTLDLAVVHLEDEQMALNSMQDVGMQLEPLELAPAPLSAADADQLGRDQLAFFGHVLVEEGGGAPGNTDFMVMRTKGRDELVDREQDSSRQVPEEVKGSLSHLSQSLDGETTIQAFAATESLLVMGMCGGPVIINPEGSQHLCVGVLEGIVPPDTIAQQGPLSRQPAPLEGRAPLPVDVEYDDAGQEVQAVAATQHSLKGHAAFIESDWIESMLEEVEVYMEGEGADGQDEAHVLMTNATAARKKRR